MDYKSIITWLVVLFSLFYCCEPVWAKFIIHSQTPVTIELTGYNGLIENTIFKGNISVNSKREINTPYRGLALMVFASGQRYPVIIGKEYFTLKITSPNKPPSFTDSGENDFFYKSLSDDAPPLKQYNFALLMIQARNLLKSSHSIKTFKELKAKKKEFHEFVRKNYENLKNSDMIKQLTAQYFMMHEYVNYHIEGVPAPDIRTKYQKEVIDGVRSWLKLSPHLPEQEILNYCVSLYYGRSMVTLASLIIKNFRDFAYCSGTENQTFSFPGDLIIAKADGNREKKLADIKGDMLISFVSDDCPVSMVETIDKVRQLSVKKENMPVIVAPLQQLSRKHLSIAGMISNGNIFFVNDEKWRKGTLEKRIRLPLFVRIGRDFDSR